MVVSATSEVMRINGVWVRRANAGLIVGAPRQASPTTSPSAEPSVDGS